MSRYRIGDIVRIKNTKTSADGKMAVVVGTGKVLTTLRLVSDDLVALCDEDKMEPMGGSSIYEPPTGAFLADRMGPKAREAEEAKVRRAEAVADIARRIEIKRRRMILTRLLVAFALWLISGCGAAALWTATLCSAEGLAGWGLGSTLMGYLVTTPMMLGLTAACAEDTASLKKNGRGRSNGKKTDD